MNLQPHAIKRLVLAILLPFFLLSECTGVRTSAIETTPKATIRFKQPLDGKCTIVIEDQNGRRIRNLVSAASFTKGPQSVAWDGRDDDGLPVKPGLYRWRSLHHSGIHPQYLMSFCNWDDDSLKSLASNHSHFTACTTNGEYLFFAAAGSEGGFSMIATDADGKFVRGYNHAGRLRCKTPFIAADDKYLYVAYDGPTPVKKRPIITDKQTTLFTLTLARYSIINRKYEPFGEGKPYATLQSYEVKVPYSGSGFHKTPNLRGLAYANGKLYISAGLTESVLVVDAESGNTLKELKLKQPGAVASAGARLMVISGKDIVSLDPDSGHSSCLLSAGHLHPRSLHVDRSWNLYVIDDETSTIKKYDRSNKLTSSFGAPGGQYAGPFQPKRMVNPSSTCVMNGRLWVTEDRDDPKRVLAWDMDKDTVAKEKYGAPPYVGRGAGFDPSAPSRWLGLKASWDINIDKRAAACRSVLGPEISALRYHFFQQDARKFVVAAGKATFICEWQSNGAMKPLACYSSANKFSHAFRWKPPDSFVLAFNKRFPGSNYVVDGKQGTPHSNAGVLWVDKSGDGNMQPDEFEFTDDTVKFAGAPWANDIHDLTIKVPVLIDKRPSMAILKPQGYYSGGAPRYQRLEECCLNAVPIQYPDGVRTKFIADSIVDRFGNMICKTDPYMCAFSPKGARLWQYPNRFVDVPGAVKAPPPAIGELQATLFFLGTAPLDSQSDVMALIGDLGRVFLLSSDGLYLDEMFHDMRAGFNAEDPLYLCREPFGGTFGQAETDGQYYLQAGPGGYRIYKIHGLDSVIRQNGNVTLSN